jgi:hypothetical protein
MGPQSPHASVGNAPALMQWVPMPREAASLPRPPWEVATGTFPYPPVTGPWVGPYGAYGAGTAGYRQSQNDFDS